MEITKEAIEKLAGLSQLKLTGEETEKFQKDAQEIVDFFDTLQKADVSGVVVDDTDNISEAVKDEERVPRGTGREKEQFMASEDDQLKVPKVL